MTSGLSLTIDHDALARDVERVILESVGLGVDAIDRVTADTRMRLQAATRAAVPGKLANAWGSRFYRNQDTNAAGNVYASGGARSKGALTYWSQEGTARGRRGQYLAIPLPAAGKPARGTGDYQLTPKEWERRNGIELRPVYRRGRLPLLVADNSRLSGARGLARASRAKRFGPAARGTATIPIFVLVPMTKFQNTVAVEAIVERGREMLRNILQG